MTADKEPPDKDINTYYVGVNDLFAVPADNVNSETEAEAYVRERFGTGAYAPQDIRVEAVDTE